MNKSRNIVLLALVTITGLWAFCEMRIYANSMVAVGPDVIVGRIANGITQWGTLGGETSFSIETTSCNIGDTPLTWQAGNRFHPVISQNLYRVKDGRIEQLGMSWLKHGFAVVNWNLCGQCQSAGSQALGVNCADTYGSGLNGNQNGLGPRSEVNAATGFFEYPHGELDEPRNVLDGRIRVANSDLDPAQNPGARYFVESQYVHPDDAAAGNGDNNASYREVAVSVSGGFQLNTQGPTMQQQPAILAWQAVHSDVRILNVDVPDDGRLIVGIRTTPGKAGGFHTEIAIENLNSHRSMRSLGVKFGSDSITNPGFNDVDYHQEPYSGTDWAHSINGSEIEWSTETFANENANALRWNTLYSFWCDSAECPSELTLGIFRPGTPTEITIDIPNVTIPADNLTVFRGTQIGGTLADTAESDDSYLSFSPGITLSSIEAPVWLIFDASLPSDNPSCLNLVLESQAGTPGLTSTLEAFNWTSMVYDVWDVSSASFNNDTIVNIDLSSGISDYVQPGTGAVRTRVGWRKTGITVKFPWEVRLDQLVWKVNQ